MPSFVEPANSKLPVYGWKLGNYLGGNRRAIEKMPMYYINRVNRMLRIAEKFKVIKSGDKILELGTGWLHWEAITTRLFFNISGILYDVCDNRQINGLKNYIKQLDNSLNILQADNRQKEVARQLIDEIKQIKNYNDLYKLIGFKYVLDPNGSLDKMDKKAFDLVVSAGVLEHVRIEGVKNFIGNLAASLKPGGFSVNSINIRDHLSQYDRKVSRKQYLRFPDWAWKIFFENEVQYINRIQRAEWLELFRKAGLSLILEEVELENISNLKVAKNYLAYEEYDLSCGGLFLIHRKPPF